MAIGYHAYKLNSMSNTMMKKEVQEMIV